MMRVRSLVLFATLACGAAACSGKVSSASGADADAAGTGGAPSTFMLTSSAFEDMGTIGSPYQCGVASESPPLSWSAGPSGTESYAIVMLGPDQTSVGTLFHWVIWDIPETTTSVPEAVAQRAMPAVPAGSRQISTGVDGSTGPGYTGPCTIFTGTYTFTVFALKVAVLPGVTPASTGAAVYSAIQENALASAQLTGLASHYRS